MERLTLNDLTDANFRNKVAAANRAVEPFEVGKTSASGGRNIVVSAVSRREEVSRTGCPCCQALTCP